MVQFYTSFSFPVRLMCCLWQELLTAATGLNTSLIEDVKARRCAGQLSAHKDISDRKALSSPNFAVIQALVALVALNGTCFSALNRTSASSPAHKCKSTVCFCFRKLFSHPLNICCIDFRLTISYWLFVWLSVWLWLCSCCCY